MTAADGGAWISGSALLAWLRRRSQESEHWQCMLTVRDKTLDFCFRDEVRDRAQSHYSNCCSAWGQFFFPSLLSGASRKGPWCTTVVVVVFLGGGLAFFLIIWCNQWLLLSSTKQMLLYEDFWNCHCLCGVEKMQDLEMLQAACGRLKHHVCWTDSWGTGAFS